MEATEEKLGWRYTYNRVSASCIPIKNSDRAKKNAQGFPEKVCDVQSCIKLCQVALRMDSHPPSELFIGMGGRRLDRDDPDIFHSGTRESFTETSMSDGENR